LTQGTTELVVLVVIFSVLDVVAAHYLDFSEIGILLPVKKVDFLEQKLFVVLELPHWRLDDELTPTGDHKRMLSTPHPSIPRS